MSKKIEQAIEEGEVKINIIYVVFVLSSIFRIH